MIQAEDGYIEVSTDKLLVEINIAEYEFAEIKDTCALVRYNGDNAENLMMVQDLEMYVMVRPTPFSEKAALQKGHKFVSIYALPYLLELRENGYSIVGFTPNMFVDALGYTHSSDECFDTHMPALEYLPENKLQHAIEDWQQHRHMGIDEARQPYLNKLAELKEAIQAAIEDSRKMGNDIDNFGAHNAGNPDSAKQHQAVNRLKQMARPNS